MVILAGVAAPQDMGTEERNKIDVKIGITVDLHRNPSRYVKDINAPSK
jgi:hypothetical protein